MLLKIRDWNQAVLSMIPLGIHMPYYFCWSFQCATRVVQLLLPYLIGDDGEFLEFGDLGRVRVDMEIYGVLVNIGTTGKIINKSSNGIINVDGSYYAL